MYTCFYILYITDHRIVNKGFIYTYPIYTVWSKTWVMDSLATLLPSTEGVKGSTV